MRLIIEKLFFCALLLVFILGCTTQDPFLKTDEIPLDAGEHSRSERPQLPDIEPMAKPDPEAGPLSLAECIQTAFMNSPTARSSWSRTHAEAMRAGQASAPRWPQMTVSSGVTRTMREQVGNVEGGFGQAPTAEDGDSIYSTEYSATFGVRQLLFDAGATRAAENAAEHALQSANLRHDSNLLDLALETQVHYYRLLNAQAMLEVAEESLRQREHHLGLAEARFEAGFVHEAEVLQARARKAEARFEIVDAENQVRTNKGRLATVMGLQPSVEYDVVEIPPEIMEYELEDVAHLMEKAVRERAGLQASAAEVKRIEREMVSEWRRKWPQLSGSGSYGRRDDKLRPRYNEWTVGLDLNWEIFTGFERSYRIRERETMVNQALEEYESELREVEREVWEAYSELLRAKESIIAAEAFVESAQESLEVAEIAYEEGRLGIGDLTDAQADHTRARGREVEARLDWYLAVSRLERSVGRTMQETEKLGG